MFAAKWFFILSFIYSVFCFADKKNCSPPKTDAFKDIKNISYSLTPPQQSKSTTDITPNEQYTVKPLERPPQEDYESPNTVYNKNGTTIKVDNRVRVKSSF